MNQEPSGILVLDKPAGISSAKAIAKVKHALGIRKIGHAGTLDPAATGVLVCLINKATKQAKQFEGGKKTYVGTILLGRTTSTDDTDGEALTTSNTIPPFDVVERAVPQFTGTISQIPPVVSAVKVDGQRSYEAFRKKGVTLALAPRTVTVDEFTVTLTEDPAVIGYRITCSSGTYVRSLARDLGAVLGCGACVATLRRSYSAPFSEVDAKPLESISRDDIKEMEN